MRVILPGHVYELSNQDGSGSQIVRFVRRRDEKGEPLPDADRHEGILTQELLRVAIDRTLYLYAEAPCDEDTAIIENLRACLVLYDARAARRSLEKLSAPETASPCPRCGHILCLHSAELKAQEGE